ncbi:MAG: cell envelope integrity EipB family protein [Rhodospirillales bacterium]|nr:cell envelope integrity EipB family protein [Alphaproteobacteria bacterium]USO03762.1 MAG: cell envelope integrity EipB family protein [Rhodospirillales bacterium]
MTLFYPWFKTFIILIVLAISFRPALAAPLDVASVLVPHKALYDIDLVATRSGSQIINISGKMFYEWKPSCEAWTTDHRFSLFYEYADSPGMRITSDFSTFEPFDGKSFDFTSRRRRDGKLYQELRGRAVLGEKDKKATYSLPEGLKYDLSAGTFFPMGHTVEMVRQAQAGKKFFSAEVFDGSDEEGPIEINTFFGSKANAMSVVSPSKNIDMSLINTPAWNVRMAVFPLSSPEEGADYEMNMIFHENGIISDMLIEYDDFSVSQKLVALEPLEREECGNFRLKKTGMKGAERALER